VPVLLVLAGVVVLMYPVVATLYNNHQQREIAGRYDELVSQAEPTALQRDLRAAKAYNKTLTGLPILDPWTFDESQSVKDPGYRRYLRQLAMFPEMGTVRVPAADISLPIRHGTSDKVLGEGAGHLYGTSLPVGGPGTHAVLTSHSGLASATLFDHLGDVDEGDMMFVSVDGQTLQYEVDDIRIVLPEKIDSLRARPRKDLLTLFTCYPYSVNTHRLLVTGHRVPYQPEADPPAASDLGIRELHSWMWWVMAASFAAMVVLALMVRRSRRQRRAEAAAGDGEAGIPA